MLNVKIAIMVNSPPPKLLPQPLLHPLSFIISPIIKYAKLKIMYM